MSHPLANTPKKVVIKYHKNKLYFRNRNKDIFLSVKNGKSRTEMAKKYKISISRATQIFDKELRIFNNCQKRGVEY